MPCITPGFRSFYQPVIALFVCLGIGLVAWTMCNFAVVTSAIADFQNARNKQSKKVSAREAEDLFEGKFKDFTHAAIIGDRTGFANGRFKLSYPNLTIGEMVVDITGYSIQGEDMLMLPDETKIQFFVVSEASKRTRF